jgi:hypothetical protein
MPDAGVLRLQVHNHQSSYIVDGLTIIFEGINVGQFVGSLGRTLNYVGSLGRTLNYNFHNVK